MASTTTRLFSQSVVYLPLQWSLLRHLAKILENGGAKLASSYREQGVTIITMVFPTLEADTSMTRLLLAEYRAIALGQGRIYYLLSHQGKPSLPNPQLDKFKLSLAARRELKRKLVNSTPVAAAKPRRKRIDVLDDTTAPSSRRPKISMPMAKALNTWYTEEEKHTKKKPRTISPLTPRRPTLSVTMPPPATPSHPSPLAPKGGHIYPRPCGHIIYIPLHFSMFKWAAALIEKSGERVTTSYRDTTTTIILFAFPTLDGDAATRRILHQEYANIARVHKDGKGPKLVAIEWLHYMVASQMLNKGPSRAQVEKFLMSPIESFLSALAPSNTTSSHHKATPSNSDRSHDNNTNSLLGKRSTAITHSEISHQHHKKQPHTAVPTETSPIHLNDDGDNTADPLRNDIVAGYLASFSDCNLESSCPLYIPFTAMASTLMPSRFGIYFRLQQPTCAWLARLIAARHCLLVTSYVCTHPP
ncbi:uncharacterized protein EHS24_002192 [Apiotrichum porosum]|uniref:BRCT domain-containing protein n=1 Tax=Apiotrichum porosum TaxID=105984 RepID=A0A427XI94_9TREE|nr:uncharacterized protein EHS24_002192 [Apiotrichum porosum]RSH78467.1 hypothetical protein EHS24_002192 [Apiotrichum porosum]